MTAKTNCNFSRRKKYLSVIFCNRKMNKASMTQTPKLIKIQPILVKCHSAPGNAIALEWNVIEMKGKTRRHFSKQNIVAWLAKIIFLPSKNPSRRQTTSATCAPVCRHVKRSELSSVWYTNVGQDYEMAGLCLISFLKLSIVLHFFF